MKYSKCEILVQYEPDKYLECMNIAVRWFRQDEFGIISCCKYHADSYPDSKEISREEIEVRRIMES